MRVDFWTNFLPEFWDKKWTDLGHVLRRMALTRLNKTG